VGSVPGPAVGFLQEAPRFLDRHLRGGPPEQEPRLRAWMPACDGTEGGRWVGEERWPVADAPWQLDLSADGTLREAGAPVVGGVRRLAPGALVGLGSGVWCRFGLDGEGPLDQAEDDAGSMVFDTEPATRLVELLGAPELQLEVVCDRPRAQLAARLCDVAPDGSVTRVSYGLLDLTHRGGHGRARAVRPGEVMGVRLRLCDCAWTFRPGHRVRVALSSGYWPIAWPAPEPVTLEVRCPGSRLLLPQREPRATDSALRPLAPPEGAAPPSIVHEGPWGTWRAVHRDPTTGEVQVLSTIDFDPELGTSGRARSEAIDQETGSGSLELFTMRAGDPLSASAEVLHDTSARRGDWSVRVRTRMELTSTADEFLLTAEVNAEEGERPFFQRRFERRIPRPGPGGLDPEGGEEQG
jgi:hypothetical protein